METAGIITVGETTRQNDGGTMKDMPVAKADEKDWQAESDCDTLMKAEEIKADKKRMSAAMKVAMMRDSHMKKMMDATRPLSKGE